MREEGHVAHTGRRKMHAFFEETWRKETTWEGLGIDGIKILKWVLKIRKGENELVSSGLALTQVAGYYVHSNGSEQCVAFF